MAAPRILIAQPTTGTVVAGTVGYLMGLVQALSARDIGWDYRQLSLPDAAIARNVFASFFMAQPGFTHLLFVDHDMGFAPETVTGLLDFDRPVVAVACPRRWLSWDRLRRMAEAEAARPEGQRRATPDLLDLALDYNVNTDRFDGAPWVAERRGGFLKLPAVGTGLMLVRRDALETMLARGAARPRPGYRDLPLLDGAPFLDFFSRLETPDGGLIAGEDISFCKRWVEDCGGEIWVDAASRVMHFGMRGHVGRYLPRALADFPGLRGGEA